MAWVRALAPGWVWCGLLAATALSLFAATRLGPGASAVVGLLAVVKATLIVHGFMRPARDAPYLARILIGYAWAVAIIVAVRMGLRIW